MHLCTKISLTYAGTQFYMRSLCNIEFFSEHKQREILTWSELNGICAVYYIAHWIQNDYLNQLEDCFYILMESCDCSLRDIIDDWPKLFPKSDNHSMLVIEYLISSLIFVRTVHNVNCLHQNKPPIIHRDLKPGNILIKSKTKIGNKAWLRASLRLCDFGLAKFDADECDDDTSASHTRGQGTQKYIAPEVESGHYTIKADIYSLGVIGKELFGYG